MFGRSFYGAAHFGPRYFGDGSDRVIASLVEAVRYSWDGLGLTDEVGPLYLNQAPRGAEPPYVVFQILSRRKRFNTGPYYLEDVTLRFHVVAYSEADAIDRGIVLENTLGFAAIVASTEGRVIRFQDVSGTLVRDAAPQAGNRPTARRTFEFRVVLARARGAA
jgi:hypothetical protein